MREGGKQDFILPVADQVAHEPFVVPYVSPSPCPVRLDLTFLGPLWLASSVLTE